MKSPVIHEILERHKQDFAGLVPFDKQKDKLLLLDFTSQNHELNEDLLMDTAKFSAYINQKLINAKARYGIGGYGEHRTLYRRSRIFEGEMGEEPRNIHLGVDIWGKPQTAVFCPLDGIVHSFAFNNQFGDYGATIVLSHQLEGLSFHTLYGHLSFNSLKNLEGGNHIEKGDIFAEFGIPSENGQWPPHLHFQVILDLQGNKGDYPGVCKFSEKEFYLNNCPDPKPFLPNGS
ncbi:MAG TPA: peptidoglycan DD-metalloendopeptidase family protein [Chitinophagaceae bacterium]|nr:peptidoglycan DD-metalloendopeptidase family protein [Chitinophagaceae bacterium]